MTVILQGVFISQEHRFHKSKNPLCESHREDYR